MAPAWSRRWGPSVRAWAQSNQPPTSPGLRQDDRYHLPKPLVSVPLAAQRSALAALRPDLTAAVGPDVPLNPAVCLRIPEEIPRPIRQTGRASAPAGPGAVRIIPAPRGPGDRDLGRPRHGSALNRRDRVPSTLVPVLSTKKDRGPLSSPRSKTVPVPPDSARYDLRLLTMYTAPMITTKAKLLET